MPGTSPKHVLLIVDDEPEVLASLRGMFRRTYHVLTANNANEAMQLLAQQPVNVILSDQRMPGVTGAEFLARAGQEYPDTITLMMTGYTDIDSVIDAINRGHVYRYVSKPWEPGELQTTIRQAFEQYDLRQERKRLIRELQDANQLKTAFISIASHEFNTPLTIVLGMLELAQAKCEDPGLKTYLDRSLRAAQRLHTMLSNTFKLLQQSDFRRSLERSEIVCSELFAEIQQDLEPFLKIRKQQLVVRRQPDDLVFRASRSHWRDVLVNLITNAIKFSPDGSTIQLSAERDGAKVFFEVQDRGVGISPDDRPHVFEPLFSTLDMLHHSTGEYGFCKRGMGVGLAIVKKFVEMHDGTVELESAPGAGSKFRIGLTG